ncbi:hypothetical protein L218DRAFT_405829 [Marasmius fiardii PR-910]|nr:hypothetical protein L218DRAFT_405829 [Marasmius fiardii PR-910]
MFLKPSMSFKKKLCLGWEGSNDIVLRPTIIIARFSKRSVDKSLQYSSQPLSASRNPGYPPDVRSRRISRITILYQNCWADFIPIPERTRLDVGYQILHYASQEEDGGPEMETVSVISTVSVGHSFFPATVGLARSRYKKFYKHKPYPSRRTVSLNDLPRPRHRQNDTLTGLTWKSTNTRTKTSPWEKSRIYNRTAYSCTQSRCLPAMRKSLVNQDTSFRDPHSMALLSQGFGTPSAVVSAFDRILCFQAISKQRVRNILE